MTFNGLHSIIASIFKIDVYPHNIISTAIDCFRPW